MREAGRYRFITSQLVFQEIASAPKRVRELMSATFTPEDVLERTAEVEELAQAYLAQKVVPSAFDEDARRVAVCTVRSDVNGWPGPEFRKALVSPDAWQQSARLLSPEF